MQDVHITVNQNAALKVLHIGHARTPIIVIDDFAADTTPLIRCAGEAVASYGPDDTSMYPGIRTKLPQTYVRSVLDALFRLFFQVYQVPADLGLKPVNAVFSLIATPEVELAPKQCAPHFDSTRPYYLAVLHYLNDGPFCDTGLFRHRETGFERITESNLERYIRSREEHLERVGAPEKAYIKDSNEQFELYDRIPYRANRLVVYPGNLLHSGLVDPQVDIDADPATGRLTANIFADFVPLDETVLR